MNLFSQTKSYDASEFVETYDNEPISFVTTKKDTLYLINDRLGKTIAGSWEGKYYVPERDGKKPYILLVEISYIRQRHKNGKEISV